MSSTEEYLDNLLKETQENEETNLKMSSNNADKEKLVQEIKDVEVDKKSVSLETSGDSRMADLNAVLGDDDIAALFAEAGIAEEHVEADMSLEEQTVNDYEEEKKNKQKVEEYDENRALDADDIAALFAEAGIADEHVEVDTSLEEQTVNDGVEEKKSEHKAEDEDDDENRALDADDIAALFAEAGIEEENITSAITDHSTEPTEENGMQNVDENDKIAVWVDEVDADSDVADLLEIMAENNDDLAEIHNLLKKSDNDDLGELEGETTRNLLPEEPEDGEKKKRKEKRGKKKFSLFGKKKNVSKDGLDDVKDELVQHKEESDESPSMIELDDNVEQNEFADLFSQLGEGEFTILDDLSGDANDFMQQFNDLSETDSTEVINVDGDLGEISEKKKKGLLTRLFDILTEEIEEEVPEIKDKPAKGKKTKKRKRDKSENEELIDELEAEDAQDKKKKKKVKKKKLPKMAVETPLETSGKKLPTKMVIRICVLCASILVLIVIISNGLITLTSLKSARTAYYNRDYETAYHNLIGKKLNDSDRLILEKTTLIMRLQRKYDSYLNNVNLGNELYACNALLEGYKLYQDSLESAKEYGIESELDTLNRLIVDALWNSYGVSEKKAIELTQIKDAQEYKESLDLILEN